MVSNNAAATAVATFRGSMNFHIPLGDFNPGASVPGSVVLRPSTEISRDMWIGEDKHDCRYTCGVRYIVEYTRHNREVVRVIGRAQ
jgi:PhoPQ-activated pathogenicity-related protein